MGLSTTPFKFFQDFETTPNGVVKTRSLKFDINALADFEQETGMGFGQLFSTKAMFATTRAMLWAGLKHQQRSLTFEGVGNLIQQWMQLDPANNTIDKLLTACFEAAKEQGALGADAPTEDGGSDTGNGPKQLEDGKTINAASQRVG